MYEYRLTIKELMNKCAQCRGKIILPFIIFEEEIADAMFLNV